MLMLYKPIYILVIFFYIIEIFLRKGKDARTLKKTKFDRGSTNLLAIAFTISTPAILVSPVLNSHGIGFIKASPVLNIIGLIIGLLGLIVRIAAAATLGRFFTRTLRQTNEHRLITGGLYKYLRHPGYLGNMLVFIGSSVAMNNYIPIIMTGILTLSVYIYRIKMEEIMLVEIFGNEYVDYQKRSKKIIPLIF
jgi:protein-S-isoprenylcysteine O-methyltransferase Ste14